ncbi:S-layer family protein, partial [Azospirillum sp. B4]|uniref:beta strand repeat-containing protein n=1 Tax=Azospirillum sp. B4 TaxID=95605 RepID=UPI0011DD268A
MAAPRPVHAQTAYTTYSGNFTSSGVTLTGNTVIGAGTIGALFKNARVNPLLITAGGTIKTGLGGIALINGSSITSIVNSGVIGGSSFAVSISSDSTLGALRNSGTILGAVINNGSTDLTLGGGTAVGTYTGMSGQGTITNTLSNLILTGGFLLNDAVNVSGHTLINSGAAVTLTSIVTVTGDYTQASGTLALGTAGQLMVSGGASLTGGLVTATLSTLASNTNYLAGDALATLVAAGSGSYSGVTGSITNSLTRFAATIGTDGTNLVAQALNDYIGASTPSLTLADTIDTNGLVAVAVFVAPSISVGTLVNTGHLTTNTIGISIGTAATIGTLVNDGTIDTHVLPGFTAQTGIALARRANVGTLSNTGTIQARYGITAFDATVGSLSNTGLIKGESHGIGIYSTASTIQTLSNGGTIDMRVGSAGILSSSTIGTLINTGAILLGANSTYNYGIIQRTTTLGVLINSGLISAPTALLVQSVSSGSGAFLTIVNSGTIAGDVSTSTLTNSVPDLTVLGGSGATVGTLTGYSGTLNPGGTAVVGVFTNATSDLYFASGNLLLNDRVTVGSHTVLNTGAALTLVNSIKVTGNYAQTGGSLVLTNSGMLSVSGSASLTNANVTVTPNAAGNYVVGSPATLVAGGTGSDFTGVSLVVSPTAHISVTSGTVGNALVLLASSNYIGGTLATLTNSGSLSAATAVYIAASGSLGQLTNTGTLSGTILNLSAVDLSITGGAAGTVGALTGGGIINTLSNVVLGGNLLLDDTVNVTGHTLVSNGASLTLSSVVAVTGNYAQTSGTLELAAGTGLVVSGTASITGGTVNAAVSTLSTIGSTYLVGDALATLVAAASGAYSGLNGTVASGLGPLTAALGTDSANLLAVATNDYIGANAASLTLTGTVDTGSIAAYVASGVSIGTLVNAGHLTAGTVGAGIDVAAASIGTLVNSGLVDARVSASTTQFGIRVGTGATIGTVSNTGTILAHVGIISQSTVGGLIANSGRIAVDGSGFAIVNNGTVATVSNSGTIAATLGGVGIYNVGSIGAVLNGGLITVSGGTGNQYGILQSLRTVGQVVNSGTIQAPDAVALVFGGSIGTLVNMGLVAGNIVNGTLNDSYSYGDLTIAGGSGGTVGTFTGYGAGSQGTISNTFSNVVFTTGDLLLNDTIDAAGHRVLNTGAGITLANTVSITGDYAQTGGSLSLTDGAQLVVSGGASLTGALVSVSNLPTQANYVVGAPTTVVAGGAGSDYTGASVVVAPQLGITLSGGDDGTNLLLLAQSDYIGGTLATLTNTGTVSAPTAVHIASTGSLGQLVNTGTLSGTIRNLSSHDLSILGGTAGTVGLLTGGVLFNTLSDVVMSGGLRLAENVNVSGHTLVNTGGTIDATGNRVITGDYVQTGGALIVASNTGLTVSGGASISGATVSGTVAVNSGAT